MAKRGRLKGMHRQAERLFKLRDHLKARRYGATLEALAGQLGVTERQIRRDLQALEDVGDLVEWSLSGEGRSQVRLVEATAKDLKLSLRQRYALLAVRGVFDVLSGTPFHEDIAAIYDKVAGSLPEEHRASLDELHDRFLYLPDGGLKAYDGKDDVLDALFTGVLMRVRVACRYRAAGKPPRPMLLEPYAMVLYKHGLYVIGRMLGEDGEPSGGEEPRVLAAERFEKADHLRGQHFEVPAGFLLADYFQGVFGLFRGGSPQRVVVDFGPEVRELVEARSWHPGQALRRLRGGGVQLAFEVENLTQVVPWVLSWGAQARVREPAALVERVLEALKGAARQYRP